MFSLQNVEKAVALLCYHAKIVNSDGFIMLSLQNIENRDNGTKINSQENKISTDLGYGLGHIFV